MPTFIRLLSLQEGIVIGDGDFCHHIAGIVRKSGTMTFPLLHEEKSSSLFAILGDIMYTLLLPSYSPYFPETNSEGSQKSHGTETAPCSLVIYIAKDNGYSRGDGNQPDEYHSCFSQGRSIGQSPNHIPQ